MSSKSAPLDPRVRLDGTGRSALEQAAEAGRHPTPRGAQHPATTAATTAKPPTSAAALKATALRVVSIPVDDIERHDPLVIVLPEGMQMDEANKVVNACIAKAHEAPGFGPEDTSALKSALAKHGIALVGELQHMPSLAVEPWYEAPRAPKQRQRG